MKILFPFENGIAVVTPAPDMDVAEIARKDVPAGVPYLIVEDDAVPSDRNYRAAWRADFSQPHGIGEGRQT